jgi:hypothetical protein
VLALSLAGCGSGAGGSSTSTGTGETVTPTVNNVQPIIVDNGPASLPAGYNVDAAFTTVTICVPGTTTCQSIDHVMVDTGSSGLRILGSALTLNLPTSTAPTGAPLGNCIQYADNSYQWGPVALADVKLAGETASSVPIQISGQAGFAVVPSACSAGGTAADTVLALGANGLLGVGNFRQDCGAACTSTSTNPGLYYACGTVGCTATTATLAGQLQNPVWTFPQDNNGLAIILPQVSASGQTTVSGSMIFGIGTQSNNSLGAAKAQALDEFGNFTTTFNGVAYSSSFIDSGSNGIYFLTSTQTGLAECTGQLSGWYCPASAVSLTAITSGPNPAGASVPVSVNVAFSIANATALFSIPNAALNNLGGTNPGVFDWGLPFFFGRTVFIGVESQVSAAGVGPYWAY